MRVTIACADGTDFVYRHVEVLTYLQERGELRVRGTVHYDDLGGRIVADGHFPTRGSARVVTVTLEEETR